MVHDNSAPAPGASISGFLLWVRILLFVALLGAGYLVWVSLQSGTAAGCGPESACNQVLQSRWAYWMDLPVSVPAVLVYLALLGATVLLQKRPSPDDQRGSWAAIIVLSVIVAGAALWFVGLQVFIIKAFCKYCLAAHACGFTAALLCLMNIPWAEDITTPMWSSGSGKIGVPRSAVLPLVAMGLAGVVLLAGGQVLFQKERNVVKVLKPGGGQAARGATPASTANATNDLALAIQTAPQLLTPSLRRIEPRLLSLYSNEFLLKLDELPMIGFPAASNIIVSLFDYTCSHCRLLHPILLETQQRFSNQLGIVSLPMPLSARCNPFLQRTAHSALNSCEYARLGLAVWRVNPEAQRQFDHWMFAPGKPPPLNQVEEYVEQLIGTNKLESVLADPWIEQQITMACRLHRKTWLATDNPAMPQLILGDAVSSGPINSVQHLMVLLNRYLRFDVDLRGF